MGRHDPLQYSPRPSGSSWRFRATLALIVFAAIAGVLLVYEHRIHLFTGNGLLIVLLALCLGMHFFMHGGHRGHGGGDRDTEDE